MPELKIVPEEGYTLHFTVANMSERITSLIDTNTREATKCQAGILPPMASLIGHTVINVSDQHLTKPHTETLEKGLNFCPTPGLREND